MESHREVLKRRLRARIATQKEVERNRAPVITMCHGGQYADLLRAQVEEDKKERTMAEAAGFVYLTRTKINS